MKRHGGLASLIVMAAFAAAAPAVAAVGSPRARYHIELSDGSRWTVVGSPEVHGSVLTFRTPDGTMMGVPREMIRRVESAGPTDVEAPVVRALEVAPGAVEATAVATETSPVETLRPGDLVVLGPLTDHGQTLAESAAAPAASVGAGAAALAAPPGAMGYGGYGGAINPNLYVNPNGTLSRAPSSTDLALALAAQPTVGSNGFPLTSNGSPTVIGPDGTPTLAPGVPGSGAPAIGPNGTPVIGETGSATTFVPIGPNGTPVLASSGQPGSEQPVIGPNGTPVLAPAGQPAAQPVVIGPNGTPELAPNLAAGSTPVVIGPNGTPVLAPTGSASFTTTVIGANGTPVLAPAGQPGSASAIIGPNGTPAAAAMRGAAPSAPASVRGPGGGGRGR